MSDAREEIIVSLEELPNYGELASLWQDLETRADCHFMLSWRWIGSWVKTHLPGSKSFLIKVVQADRVIGLAIAVFSWKQFGPGLTVRCLNLHSTGNPDQDEICIEYNGILSERGLEALVAEKAIEALKTATQLPAGITGWDILNLSQITDQGLEFFQSSGLKPWFVSIKDSYCTHLKPYRETGEDYLASLSKNSRQQIRRSIRLYEERGPLELRRAETPEQAIQFFREAGDYHHARWRGDPGPNIFQDSGFSVFHEALFADAVDAGEVDILQVRAGDFVIGYLHNFLYRGRVYFYLCAFYYEEDSRLKPGLVSHKLAIEYYLGRGLDVYDFMAGGSRYKKSLGEKEHRLSAVYLCRSSLKLRLAFALRRLKALLQPVFGKASGSGS